MANILIGISGGIAVYKVASLVSYLKKNGDNVKVIMTKNATEFVTPLTFQTLSKEKVITNMFNEAEYDKVAHIYYPQEWADIFVIAPATANVIGKVANGIADDMLTSSIIATTVPVLFVPAMNTHMYANYIVQKNMKELSKYGYEFVEPDVGMLACDYEGIGKFPKLDKITNKINEILKRGV